MSKNSPLKFQNETNNKKKNSKFEKSSQEYPSLRTIIGSLLSASILTILIIFISKIDLQRKYDLVPELHDLLLMIPGFVFSSFVFYGLPILMKPFLLRHLPAQSTRENETTDERTERVSLFFGSLFCYGTYSILALMVSIQENLVPKFLFGGLDFDPINKDWPPKISLGMKLLHLMNYGGAIERMVTLLVFEREKRMFFELYVHHILTLFMLGLSYHAKINQLAVVLLLISYLPDFFLNAARLAREFQRETVAHVSFAFLIVSWPLLRIFSLFFEVIIPALGYSRKKHPVVVSFFELYLFFVIGVIGLLCLNAFWFYQMILVLKNLLQTKPISLEYEDTPIVKKIN